MISSIKKRIAEVANGNEAYAVESFVLSATRSDQETCLPGSSEILHQSRQMVELVTMAKRFAQSSASVMICGASGTGKELFSRLIHQQSRRRHGPLVAVNCAAVSESLIESELFGHSKGSFTGAVADHIGYFEQAHQGTLFLDEVTEVPVSIQAKLLRVLEEGELLRVGSTQPRQIDVRIVATTNRDLPKAIEDGTFREDLYHRLNVLELIVPPLRDRVADIPVLAVNFLRQFRNESAAGVQQIDRSAMEALCRYPWPGNVRELRNVIHRACVVATEQTIGVSDLPEKLTGDSRANANANDADVRAIGRLEAAHCRPDIKLLDTDPSCSNAGVTQASTLMAPLTLAEIEKQTIIATLQKYDGNKRIAAEELGVTSRTLSNKLKQYAAE
ncbi:MAG: sigma-54 dependent transcriptional regulator [Planctomycetota bacterium]